MSGGRSRRTLGSAADTSYSGSDNASKASRRHKPDYWLVVLAAALLTFGLVVVYSISPGLAASQHISQNYFITKQLIAVGAGIVTFGLAAFVPSRFWLRAAWPLAIAAVVGSAIVMLTPTDAVFQAHRWIRVGGFSFQVAELIKLALLVGLAAFLAEQWRRGRLANFKQTLKPLLILLIVVGLVMVKLQSDLGSLGVIVAMIGLMAYSAGIPLKRVALISLLIIALAGLAISTSSYRRDRLTNFLHPQSNCQSTGYQACQALISVGSGGLFGLGLGYSVQAYGYLPEASNDSIFAIIAEKFGFVGAVVILVIYGAFFTRIRRIIARTNDQFRRLLAVGVLAWLSTQMIINVGAMAGLLPLKGITLPLISQGGTSLIFLTAALGIVFQISRYTSYNVTEPTTSLTENSSASNSFDGRGDRRPHNPSLVTRPRT